MSSPITTSQARVLVIGLGGLGCPATLALARGGVRRMTLVDGDEVERSNLPRQLWHQEADLGRAKVDSAAEKLGARFTGLGLRTVRERVGGARLAALIAEHDLVLDCVDGVETKFALSDAAVAAGVPLVHAGALGLEAQVLRVRPGGPCLRCLFEAPPPPELAQSCARSGVLGSVVGLAGAVQAARALEWLSGSAVAIEEEVEPLWQFDARTLRARVRPVRRAADCPCARSRPKRSVA